jgi:hypothetical protein
MFENYLLSFFFMCYFLIGAPLTAWAQGGHYKGVNGSSHDSGS